MSEAPAEQKGTITLQKRHVLIALLILQIWPLMVVIYAQMEVPAYQQIFQNLFKGAPLFWITRLVFQTYPWWWLFPMGTTLLALVTLSRWVKTVTVPALCVVLTLVSGMLLREAVFAGTISPIIEAMQKLSGGGP